MDFEATAVIAANDQMALGAVRALTEMGRRVPADVSVSGMDDVPEAAYFDPPLTTIRLNFAVQGRVAVNELLRRLGGPQQAEVNHLTADLVVPSSTGPAL